MSVITHYHHAGHDYTLTSRNAVQCEGKRTGLFIQRGAVQGGSDDRCDRWYVRVTDSTEIDRRGPGYATREDALQGAADYHHDSHFVIY